MSNTFHAFTSIYYILVYKPQHHHSEELILENLVGLYKHWSQPNFQNMFPFSLEYSIIHPEIEEHMFRHLKKPNLFLGGKEISYQCWALLKSPISPGARGSCVHFEVPSFSLRKSKIGPLGSNPRGSTCSGTGAHFCSMAS